MGSKNDLLKTSWTTLLAAFFFMATLALANRANAAVDVEQAIPNTPVASVMG